MFNVFQSLPVFLSTNDLIKLGIYANKNSAYSARSRGKSPDHIKFGRKILYSRETVIEFISRHIVKKIPQSPALENKSKETLKTH